MKLNFLLLSFLFLGTLTFGQDKICGVEHPEDFGILMNEEKVQRLQEIEEFTQEWISQNQDQATPREIITIPVVVHNIYFDESEKFSDLEIQAQIDGLNADFRKRNDNQNIIPEMFRSVVADVELEFCLASVKPNGELTNGIIRKSTDQPNIGAPAFGRLPICHDDLGGSDAWDPKTYINIWVGQLGFGIGRATMPGLADTPSEDGIWIDPTSFGFFCSTESGFYLGRTLTHEMGHYLNLFHTWGGCMIDDLVEDTPWQAKSYAGCPTHPQFSCDSEDMFMNFMDYSDDNCLAMFTEGQKERMLATLADGGPREELTTSQGCDWIKTPDFTLTPDDIQIFPNPANNCVHIDLDIDNNNDLPVKMAIYNTAGQAVYSSEIYVEDLRTFDISKLSNGIYFVYFETKDQVASKKLIVDK